MSISGAIGGSVMCRAPQNLVLCNMSLPSGLRLDMIDRVLMCKWACLLLLRLGVPYSYTAASTDRYSTGTIAGTWRGVRTARLISKELTGFTSWYCANTSAWVLVRRNDQQSSRQHTSKRHLISPRRPTMDKSTWEIDCKTGQASFKPASGRLPRSSGTLMP